MKHVNEFVNDSSLWHLLHVETSQAKNSKTMAEKESDCSDDICCVHYTCTD